MAIVVEHDKRKQEILQKSLDVFIEEGYEDATFQKIADRCGITRTTLYIYFKNKHEIFLGSIKELLGHDGRPLVCRHTLPAGRTHQPTVTHSELSIRQWKRYQVSPSTTAACSAAYTYRARTRLAARP